jgi:glucose-1-phosphate thymidylyltransferase
MNVLILAAGYATRLYPLTLNKAKPLLEIAGKPMIERLVDHLDAVPDLETVYVDTNLKFAADFQNWADRYRARHPKFTFKIVNDGSTSDADKLGAIGDINLVLTHENLAANDLLVVAGIIFLQPLRFVEFIKRPKRPSLCMTSAVSKQLKYGTVTVDALGRHYSV